jgi:hypothetical protein
MAAKRERKRERNKTPHAMDSRVPAGSEVIETKERPESAVNVVDIVS